MKPHSRATIRALLGLLAALLPFLSLASLPTSIAATPPVYCVNTVENGDNLYLKTVPQIEAINPWMAALPVIILSVYWQDNTITELKKHTYELFYDFDNHIHERSATSWELHFIWDIAPWIDSRQRDIIRAVASPQIAPPSSRCSTTKTMPSSTLYDQIKGHIAFLKTQAIETIYRRN